MNDVQLECVSGEKDLGVIISVDLKWEKQCSEAVKKANRMLGMIKRNFIDRSKETIIIIQKSGQTSPEILLPDMESLLQEGHKVN